MIRYKKTPGWIQPAFFYLYECRKVIHRNRGFVFDIAPEGFQHLTFLVPSALRSNA
ncbi:Hypothetical protein ACI5QL_00718 [Bacillus velezensis]